ncbi:MAG: biotin--[acetyl-CoA-carboxylase] ligase, partial [Oscillospiraceae bacterium]
MSVKSSVLQMLEANRGNSVSGQQLANELGVSRSAVWKAIKALETDGYAIEAVTNKGYLLASSNDLISAEGINNYLAAQYKKLPITALKTVSSTNTHARMMAANGAKHGTIVVSEEQTNGKGRMGRTFFSPEGSGIYMSIILRPNTHTTNAVFITTAAAVAVCRAIAKLTVAKPTIKWVNDIILRDKKICGILTEAVTDFENGMVESVVVGIGINFKEPDI